MRKTILFAMVAGTLLVTSCASKKDLVNCQNENRELTNNYQDTKEKLAARPAEEGQRRVAEEPQPELVEPEFQQREHLQAG